MALVKIADLYPNYVDDIFGGDDIKGFDVYSDTEDQIGSVDNIIVDENGKFRYLVVDTGFWIFGKKVLLPVGRSNIDYQRRRVYALGMTKEQAEALPEYHDDLTVDFDYEERVRGVYRTAMPTTNDYTYDTNTYSYDQDSLYQLQDDSHLIRLYEERLIANKERFRTGAVTIGKHIETETAQVAVPVEREQVVIERMAPTDTNPVATNVDFQEGEVARVEVYEEKVNIDKQAFVREEVNISKEVQRETVEAKETVRREELDIDTEGNPTIQRDSR